QIDPQTLSTIIQQFDLNNQIDNETIEYLLQNIDLDAQVDSDVLSSALDGFIYENQEFAANEIDIEALALALFSVYEQESLAKEFGSENLPTWTKTIAVHYSDGKISPSELESATVDCGVESFSEKIDFNNLDNMFELWASSLPICAMTQIP
ncbi:MAG: hypothetical protein V3V58_00750, partial [Nitrosopumilaceae archaeon]